MRSFLFVNKINYLIGIYIVKKVGLNEVYRKHNQYQIDSTDLVKSKKSNSKKYKTLENQNIQIGEKSVRNTDIKQRHCKGN